MSADRTVSSQRPAEPVRAPREIHCQGNTFVVRARLQSGRVSEAWSTGWMTRNVNLLLRGGLDSLGRPQFSRQVHCLCNDGHALAAIRALEDLAGVVPPRGAQLVRSLVQALRCMQEHLLHVYQFHLSDWADPEAALRANPARCADMDGAPGRGAPWFLQARDRLDPLVRARRDAAGGDPMDGHPAYPDSDALHLLIHAHGLDSLRIGAAINEALGLLGCGAEGYRAYRLGGLPEDLDLNGERLSRLRALLLECRDFVRTVFLADLERLAAVHTAWADLGRSRAFLALGDFARPGRDGLLFPGGIVIPGTGGECTECTVDAVAPGAVREDAEPAWNGEDRDRYRLRPEAGPAFTRGNGDFFWLPAPRLGDTACEAGPLARVLTGWALGRTDIRRVLAKTLNACGFAPCDMNSTLGRVLARGVESAVLAEAAPDWLDELSAVMGQGAGRLRADVRLPASGLGTGRVEVPRGSLTHTIRLENGRIASHDYLIPSLWNFSPRDERGERGPLERALLDTPVADQDRPLELLRTIHELDPCNACHLVIENADTGRVSVTTAK